ncbi:MAG: hypothetical protein K6E88_03955 [Lachnospiraceae bacterium]|nr:hypothetical protein [Lachnospiraceae bacterium]
MNTQLMKKIMWGISLFSLIGTAIVLLFMPDSIPMHHDTGFVFFYIFFLIKGKDNDIFSDINRYDGDFFAFW